mgnify:CR=1 FL=1|tara:strand:- start:858 stop:1082 length:225 start_codon:yes stop_codon:yes gene_type:complete
MPSQQEIAFLWPVGCWYVWLLFANLFPVLFLLLFSTFLDLSSSYIETLVYFELILGFFPTSQVRSALLFLESLS